MSANIKIFEFINKTSNFPVTKKFSHHIVKVCRCTVIKNISCSITKFFSCTIKKEFDSTTTKIFKFEVTKIFQPMVIVFFCTITSCISSPWALSASQFLPDPVNATLKQAPSTLPIITKARNALMEAIRRGFCYTKLNHCVPKSKYKIPKMKQVIS